NIIRCRLNYSLSKLLGCIFHICRFGSVTPTALVGYVFACVVNLYGSRAELPCPERDTLKIRTEWILVVFPFWALRVCCLWFQIEHHSCLVNHPLTAESGKFWPYLSGMSISNFS